MEKTKATFADLERLLGKSGIEYIVTRYWEGAPPDDLDILVKKHDFMKARELLVEGGYTEFSHDHALGGRIKGAQVNLVKKGRVKIDLHNCFSWRAHEYLDNSFVWKSAKRMPTKEVDAFLIMINVLFEKTYFTEEEKALFWNLRKKMLDSKFEKQAKKYNWLKSYKLFTKWVLELDTIKPLPRFVPFYIVLVSYFEKFHFVSFLYYFYFRLRYVFTRVLPYD